MGGQKWDLCNTFNDNDFLKRIKQYCSGSGKSSALGLCFEFSCFGTVCLNLDSGFLLDLFGLVSWLNCMLRLRYFSFPFFVPRHSLFDSTQLHTPESVIQFLSAQSLRPQPRSSTQTYSHQQQGWKKRVK